MKNDEYYEELERVTWQAKKICDPLEFAFRQNKLLHAIADYILRKDNIEKDIMENDETK